jgi:MFS family permease
MQNTAQVLLAYQLTHSVFGVGLVTCAQFSGSLILGPWAAVVANRIGGKPTLIAGQLLAAGLAGCLAVMQATGSLSEGVLIGGALGLGLVFAFVLPIQNAMIPRLVTPAATEAAMAMNSVSYNAGRAVAPVISVVVIATNGFDWAFAANALSFLFFAAILAKVRQGTPTPTRQMVRARDGIRVAFRRPRVMLLLAIVAAVTFADDPVLIQGPALAHHVHAPSDVAGYFIALLGLGTVLGSVGPIRNPKKWNSSLASKRAAWSLVLLFVCIVVFAAGFAEWISLLAAFSAGAAVLYAGALAQARLTRQRPEHVAGVMALWAIAWAGTKPIASLTDGWLSSHTYLWLAAATLAAPALLLGLGELFLRDKSRNSIKEFGNNRMANWFSSSSPLATEPEAVRQ